ncbi:hypothetical protein M8J76_000289 [Diaphorina citri]|nr:hypothetical protein M8J76_000289 [Diaphorina citri]
MQQSRDECNFWCQTEERLDTCPRGPIVVATLEGYEILRPVFGQGLARPQTILPTRTWFYKRPNGDRQGWTKLIGEPVDNKCDTRVTVISCDEGCQTDPVSSKHEPMSTPRPTLEKLLDPCIPTVPATCKPKKIHVLPRVECKKKLHEQGEKLTKPGDSIIKMKEEMITESYRRYMWKRLNVDKIKPQESVSPKPKQKVKCKRRTMPSDPHQQLDVLIRNIQIQNNMHKSENHVKWVDKDKFKPGRRGGKSGVVKCVLCRKRNAKSQSTATCCYKNECCQTKQSQALKTQSCQTQQCTCRRSSVGQSRLTCISRTDSSHKQNSQFKQTAKGNLSEKDRSQREICLEKSKKNMELSNANLCSQCRNKMRKGAVPSDGKLHKKPPVASETHLKQKHSTNLMPKPSLTGQMKQQHLSNMLYKKSSMLGSENQLKPKHLTNNVNKHMKGCGAYENKATVVNKNKRIVKEKGKLKKQANNRRNVNNTERNPARKISVCKYNDNSSTATIMGNPCSSDHNYYNMNEVPQYRKIRAVVIVNNRNPDEINGPEDNQERHPMYDDKEEINRLECNQHPNNRTSRRRGTCSAPCTTSTTQDVTKTLCRTYQDYRDRNSSKDGKNVSKVYEDQHEMCVCSSCRRRSHQNGTPCNTPTNQDVIKRNKTLCGDRNSSKDGKKLSKVYEDQHESCDCTSCRRKTHQNGTPCNTSTTKDVTMGSRRNKTLRGDRNSSKDGKNVSKVYKDQHEVCNCTSCKRRTHQSSTPCNTSNTKDGVKWHKTLHGERNSSKDGKKLSMVYEDQREMCNCKSCRRRSHQNGTPCNTPTTQDVTKRNKTLCGDRNSSKDGKKLNKVYEDQHEMCNYCKSCRRRSHQNSTPSNTSTTQDVTMGSRKTKTLRGTSQDYYRDRNSSTDGKNLMVYDVVCSSEEKTRDMLTKRSRENEKIFDYTRSKTLKDTEEKFEVIREKDDRRNTNETPRNKLMKDGEKSKQSSGRKRVGPKFKKRPTKNPLRMNIMNDLEKEKSKEKLQSINEEHFSPKPGAKSKSKRHEKSGDIKQKKFDANHFHEEHEHNKKSPNMNKIHEVFRDSEETQTSGSTLEKINESIQEKDTGGSDLISERLSDITCERISDITCERLSDITYESSSDQTIKTGGSDKSSERNDSDILSETGGSDTTCERLGSNQTSETDGSDKNERVGPNQTSETSGSNTNERCESDKTSECNCSDTPNSTGGSDIRTCERNGSDETRVRGSSNTYETCGSDKTTERNGSDETCVRGNSDTYETCVSNVTNASDKTSYCNCSDTPNETGSSDIITCEKNGSGETSKRNGSDESCVRGGSDKSERCGSDKTIERNGSDETCVRGSSDTHETCVSNLTNGSDKTSERSSDQTTKSCSPDETKSKPIENERPQIRNQKNDTLGPKHKCVESESNVHEPSNVEPESTATVQPERKLSLETTTSSMIPNLKEHRKKLKNRKREIQRCLKNKTIRPKPKPVSPKKLKFDKKFFGITDSDSSHAIHAIRSEYLLGTARMGRTFIQRLDINNTRVVEDNTAFNMVKPVVESHREVSQEPSQSLQRSSKSHNLLTRDTVQCDTKCSHIPIEIIRGRAEALQKMHTRKRLALDKMGKKIDDVYSMMSSLKLSPMSSRSRNAKRIVKYRPSPSPLLRKLVSKDNTQDGFEKHAKYEHSNTALPLKEAEANHVISNKPKQQGDDAHETNDTSNYETCDSKPGSTTMNEKNYNHTTRNIKSDETILHEISELDKLPELNRSVKHTTKLRKIISLKPTKTGNCQSKRVLEEVNALKSKELVKMMKKKYEMSGHKVCFKTPWESRCQKSK